MTTTLAAWSALSAGEAHTCGVRSGVLRCWGRNTNSELGQNDFTDRLAPVEVTQATVWASVFTRVPHTCGLKTDGTLWCWGDNDEGALGIGNTVTQTRPKKVDGSASGWSSVATGSAHSCAIAPGISLACWGLNHRGQLGRDAFVSHSTPQQLLTLDNWVVVSTGWHHSCATVDIGQLKCWGGNYAGQLGIGGSTDQTSPQQVGAATTVWSEVYAGHDHTCAIQPARTLWCWGVNGDGQLGLGDVSSRDEPEQVLSSDGVDADWAGVSGALHTCGIRIAVRSLWCWGANGSGQLGLGDTTGRTEPIRVGTGTNWLRVSAGSFHSCGRRAPGSLWCWGINSSGQLGVGDFVMRSSPTLVG